VYSINIVYFDLGTGDDYIYHGVSNFKGLHTNNELQLNDEQKQLYNKTCIGDLYPEYYILKVKNFDDIAKDTLDEWIYYLKNNKILDDFTAKGLDKARKVLAFDNMSDEEKKQYNYNIEVRRIKESEIHTALREGERKGLEKGMQKGLQKGLEKGLEKGMQKGLEKGLEKGRAEEKEETVRNAKSLGLSAEQIHKLTNLPIDEIETIE
jgi:predicted transposase/invertase (TIGR01784 family)